MLLKTLVVLIFMLVTTVNNNTFASHEHEGGKEDDWNPVSAGPVTTWTAPLCSKRKFVIQPFLFYNHTRGVFNSDSHYDSLPKGDKKYQYQEQIFMQYGLNDKLEVDAQTVYQQNYRKQGDLKAHSAGVGDSYLFLRWCALEETHKLPHITGIFQMKIPTGKYQKLAPDKLGTDSMGATSGAGSFDHGYGINLTKKLKPFVWHADAIYGMPLEREIDGIKIKYDRYLNYDFGVEYFFLKGFNLMWELNGFLQGDKEQNGYKVAASDINYLTFGTGLGWSNNKIQTLLVYQRTLIGTNADANDSVVVTLVYTF